MRYAVKSAPPPGGDRREFVMSDGSIDRMGEVIEPSGWDLSSFSAGAKFNPIALFNHKADMVVGSWSNVRVHGGRLIGRFEPAAPGTSEIADTVCKLIDQDILRAVSVGFEPTEREPMNEKASPHHGPFRFKRQTLLECSVVSVPANPNAVAIARSLNLPFNTVAKIFGETARDVASAPARSCDAVTGKPAKSLVAIGTTMTLSQRIQAAQQRINGLRDQVSELANKDDLSDDEIKLTDELPDLLAAEQRELERWEKMEKAHAPRAGQAPQIHQPPAEIIPPGSPVFILPKKKVEPVDYAWRAIAASVRSFGSQTALESVLREMYGSDEGTRIVLRAAVNPAMMTVAGYAAELAQTAYGGLMDRLIANSLYGPLSGIGSRFDFGGNGTLKIPTRSSTPRAAGAWVGEGSPKPVKRIGLSSITLSPHKLSVITTFTEEMAFYSTPAIEGVLQKAMGDDTREALDGYLIDNVAASAARPAGLLNGVTPITASAAVGRIDKIVADINGLIAPMEAAGGGGNVVLLMNPAQARIMGMAQTTTGDFAFTDTGEAASKFGIKRILESITVPAGTVIAVDADWFTTATGDSPRFAVSNEATLHEEDTTPLALGTTGTPNVVAAPMRSLFQTDSIAIRLSLYVTWAMTRTGMVQTIAGVGW